MRSSHQHVQEAAAISAAAGLEVEKEQQRLQYEKYLHEKHEQERARLEMERLVRHGEELQLHAKKHDERRERKERERERREEERKQKELERIGKYRVFSMGITINNQFLKYQF